VKEWNGEGGTGALSCGGRAVPKCSPLSYTSYATADGAGLPT